MKKLVFLVVLAGVLLCGCSENGEGDVTEGAVALPSVTEIAVETTAEITLVEITEAEIVEKPQFEYDWQELYYQKMSENDWWGDIAMFNVFDLDGDGIPELMISHDDASVPKAKIFTMKNGELKELGGYGSYGWFAYDFERGYIHDIMTGQGQYISTIYKLDCGEMIEIISFYDVFDSWRPDGYFEINGEEVSSEVYYDERENYNYNYDNFISREYNLNPSEAERILRSSVGTEDD
ncbi:MAG: hypothetical protein FWG90_09330 [Oscillospiraceae bacterium]|nr:hypothetical protein [Oscillospiraceae bacterium]